ncbi:hypothetical protein K431DRAFT_223262 [Polychaeton citri CBS 116435]|uniref:Myb-like domain-containing protein n=1 Tax=Polychaeton citri CBS 116435 TaxID=1314669 RepID=A0A9P4UPH9_9PEZI|nr:hypothetical protein K431DRAFT_223262 [Polychaeton citri CBS 116435]
MPSPYPHPSTVTTQQRTTAIWSAADDEVLLQARASGLNWQPIASRHFPTKTANACRKRHERLIERRHVEDWDAQKLGLLAEEYMAVRKEMWEVLANRLGERWNVVEAKCMEKGLKTLQTVSRQAQRKASANSHAEHESGISDHNSDSGIGLGSDAEMDVQGESAGPSRRPSYNGLARVEPHSNLSPRQRPIYEQHSRSHSLPQPLPLYQPPPPVPRHQRRPIDGLGSGVHFHNISLNGHQPPSVQRCSPESQGGRSAVSIQSMLAPLEP